MKSTPSPVSAPQPGPSAVGATVRGALSFIGFDEDKLAAAEPKSAKYTFAKLALRSGVMPRSKLEAESWFNEHIRPGMNAAGFQVDQVKRHQVFIHTRENPQGEWVDFMRFHSLAWEMQDTGTASVQPRASPAAIDWNPFLGRLIATLQQLRDPGLTDEQRLQGLRTLFHQLGAKLNPLP